MLAEKIKALYPQLTDSDFAGSVLLLDDGDSKGPYIAKWPADIPRPTDKQIEDAKPAESAKVDPLAKLVDFLKANPDVLDLVTKSIQVEGKAK